MDMQFFFFNVDEEVIGILHEAETCRVDEGNYTAELEFRADVDFSYEDAYAVAFEDIDGVLTLWELTEMKASSANGLATINFTAELAAMSELLDEVITGKAVSGAQPGYATMRVIEDTRWTLKSTETTQNTVSDMFYFTNVWAALKTIRDATGCAHYFGITVTGNAITERYITVKARAGESRGRTFDTGRDMSAFEIEIDRSGVYTRLYGRGKGEEVGETDSGEKTYGRRIDFADVVWDTDDGDPIDKPEGQIYIEDPAATALFGRGPSGSKRPRQQKVITTR